LAVLYKKQKRVFGQQKKSTLGQDLNDWKNLSDGERHFISHVLAFFAASDGIVNENLAEHFVSEVQYTEAKFFLWLPDCHGKHPQRDL
jgi:ribonucleoside-diphosphate reductase beta chain